MNSLFKFLPGRDMGDMKGTLHAYTERATRMISVSNRSSGIFLMLIIKRKPVSFEFPSKRTGML